MKIPLLWLLPVCLLAIPVSMVQGQTTSCDDIQYYDPVTGAPASPHDGDWVIVQGVIIATALTFDYGTYFIHDLTGGIRLDLPGWYDEFAVGDEIEAEGYVTTTAAGEIMIEVWFMSWLGSYEEPDAAWTSIGNLLDPPDYEKVGDFIFTEGMVSHREDSYFSLEVAGGDSVLTLQVDVDPDTDIDVCVLDVGDYCRVTGFCTNVGGEIRLLPRCHRDLVENPWGDEPPVITDVDADNWFPTSTDPITITAVITDSTAITGATLYYRDSCFGCPPGPFSSVTMVLDWGDTYRAVIPPPHTLPLVEFYVEATDGVNPPTTAPACGPWIYYSLAIGFSDIHAIQYVDPREPDQSSPAWGSPLSVVGRVTVGTRSDAAGHRQFIIQQYDLTDGEPYDPRWQALLIDQGGLSRCSFEVGQKVRAFGFVSESDDGLTHLKVADDDHLEAVEGVFIPPAPAYAPISVFSDTIAFDEGGVQGEAYECVWIRTRVCTVLIDDGHDLWILGQDMTSIPVRPLDEVQHTQMAYGTYVTVEGFLNSRNRTFEIVPTDGSHIVTGMSPVEDRPVGANSAGRIVGIAPNPFNPTTTIRFVLREEALACLDLFDARGRLVRRLLAEPLAGKEHSVTWDGNDDRGRSAASGTYFVRLRIGNENLQVEPLMLVK